MSGNDDYNHYYNLFMKQFIETLAQLSAVLVTSTLAVPAYTYYSRRNLVKNENNQTQFDIKKVSHLSSFSNQTDTESNIDVDDSTSSLLDDI